MSDSLDISMDDVVAQYRDELAKHIGEKLLLQAAVKLLGEQATELRQQVQQLTTDLETAVQARPMEPDHSWKEHQHQNGPVSGQFLPPLREKKANSD